MTKGPLPDPPRGSRLALLPGPFLLGLFEEIATGLSSGSFLMFLMRPEEAEPLASAPSRFWSGAWLRLEAVVLLSRAPEGAVADETVAAAAAGPPEAECEDVSLQWKKVNIEVKVLDTFGEKQKGLFWCPTLAKYFNF